MKAFKLHFIMTLTTSDEKKLSLNLLSAVITVNCNVVLSKCVLKLHKCDICLHLNIIFCFLKHLLEYLYQLYNVHLSLHLSGVVMVTHSDT